MEEKKTKAPNTRPVPPPPPPPRTNVSAQKPVQTKRAQNAAVQNPNVNIVQRSAAVQQVAQPQNGAVEVERIKGKNTSKWLTALYWISFVLALGAIGLLIYLLVR